MAVNDLALSWKDHHNVLISVFENLLEKKALVDCTLAAEGKFLKAHKIVLSACSPYLEALLNQEDDKHPIIFLRDVQFEDLKTLVEFVYSGEIRIPEDRLVEFLNIAEALQIKGLGGAGSETNGKKQQSEPPQKRDTASPVPKKRLRSHSKPPEPASQDKNETVTADALPTNKIQKKDESQIKVVNICSSESSSKTKAAPEELKADLRKVKEEIISTAPSESAGVSVEPLSSESVPSEIVEDHSELKPQFEEVTFTEDYSDDMLLEDSNTSESVINPLHDQPGSSHQYSGFSAEPVETCGLAEQTPYIVSDLEQQPSEGFIGFPKKTPIYEPLSGNASERWGPSSKSDVTSFSTVPAAVDPVSQRIVCPCCPMSFGTKSIYLVHLRSHTGEKPYKCEFCDMCFSQVGNLKRHKLKHTNEKPHLCSVCPRRFKLKADLFDHMGVHTRIKQHVCNHCGRSFLRPCLLIRHAEVAHGIQ